MDFECSHPQRFNFLEMEEQQRRRSSDSGNTTRHQSSDSLLPAADSQDGRFDSSFIFVHNVLMRSPGDPSVWVPTCMLASSSVLRFSGHCVRLCDIDRVVAPPQLGAFVFQVGMHGAEVFTFRATSLSQLMDCCEGLWSLLAPIKRCARVACCDAETWNNSTAGLNDNTDAPCEQRRRSSAALNNEPPHPPTVRECKSHSVVQATLFSPDSSVSASPMQSVTTAPYIE